jgi:hypothetical protein
MSVCFGKAPTSSCEVPCVSVLCFAHSQAADAGRKTNWGTVLTELVVSRCFSQIRFLLREPKVRCCVHRCPDTGLNSETLECPSYIAPCFSKLFPSFLRSPIWPVALRPVPKLCVNSLRLIHLVLPWNAQED